MERKWNADIFISNSDAASFRGKILNREKFSDEKLDQMHINQVGAFRPKNKDEKLSNLYYVGASTTPGTGLPMVIISSKLVTERIENDFRTLH